MLLLDVVLADGPGVGLLRLDETVVHGLADRGMVDGVVEGMGGCGGGGGGGVAVAALRTLGGRGGPSVEAFRQSLVDARRDRVAAHQNVRAVPDGQHGKRADTECGLQGLRATGREVRPSRSRSQGRVRVRVLYV